MGDKKVNTTNLKIIRLRLEDDRKRLVEQLDQIRANRSSEDRREGSPFGKREEEATETAELENRMALEKRVLDQLAKVENALSKFEKGTYGICESCGKPIDPKRLEALPQATLCMSCKAAQAKNGKV
jgi:DnaK suppressor protein